MLAAEPPINAGSGTSHQCRVTSGSFTTLTIPTMTCAEIRAAVMMVVGAWVWKWRYGDGITLDVFLFLSSILLFFGSQPGINGIGTRFTTSRTQSLGDGVSPCTGSAERSPLSCTDRLWDLWVHTIAYVGCLFHSLFPFPSHHLYWLSQPRRSAPKEGDNVTAWLHVTCPGPGNPRYI